MSDQAPSRDPQFLVTKEYRRFAEFCDACRRHRSIGIYYDAPGVGKTLSAWRYTHWDIFDPFLAPYRLSASLPRGNWPIKPTGEIYNVKLQKQGETERTSI